MLQIGIMQVQCHFILCDLHTYVHRPTSHMVTVRQPTCMTVFSYTVTMPFSIAKFFRRAFSFRRTADVPRCDPEPKLADMEGTEFANLPGHVLMTIFRHLPLESKVKLGRTSRRLYDLSTVSISETECIDLADYQLRKMTVEDLEKLLKSCAKDVKRIRLPLERNGVLMSADEASNIVGAISAHSYPRLEEINLGCAPGDHLLVKFIRECPNLQSFAWYRRRGKLLAVCLDTICETLTIVRLGRCEYSTVQSVVKHCPNLKNVQFDISQPVPMADVDERVFAYCGKVETMDVGIQRADQYHPTNGAGLVHFWAMTSLRSLVLDVNIDNSFLFKIAECFQQLRSLGLRQARYITGVGIGGLAVLPDLRRLHMATLLCDVDDEEHIRRLAERGLLEEISLNGIFPPMTSATFLSFIRCCTDLRCISLLALDDVTSPSKAVKVIRQMIGRKRDLEVDLGDALLRPRSDWKDKKVKAALAKVNRKNGCVIKISGV